MVVDGADDGATGRGRSDDQISGDADMQKPKPHLETDIEPSTNVGKEKKKD